MGLVKKYLIPDLYFMLLKVKPFILILVYWKRHWMPSLSHHVSEKIKLTIFKVILCNRKLNSNTLVDLMQKNSN